MEEKTSLEKELGKGTFNLIIKDKKNKIKTVSLKTIENVGRFENISHVSKEMDLYTHFWSVNKN